MKDFFISLFRFFRTFMSTIGDKVRVRVTKRNLKVSLDIDGDNQSDMAIDVNTSLTEVNGKSKDN